MNILFLSRWFPLPADNGSKIRIYNLLRGLNQYHDVTLLSFTDQAGVSPEAPEVREICSRVSLIRWREFNPHSLRARAAMLSLKPRSIVDTFSSEMARKITAILNERQYDLIIASQLQMAAYAPYFKNIPAVFEEFEIGLFHDGAFSAEGRLHFRRALTWFKLRLYLSHLLFFFNACTTASERERQLLAGNFPAYKGLVEVIPNCLNASEYARPLIERKPKTIVFTGSFRYHTNHEAMVWFVREVFPLILERIPDAQLIITGDHANLPLPSYQNVVLAGYVEDIKSVIASCSVSIAPLWSGGGTRLKILEAMALGVPVVATSKGAEGLDVQGGEHLLIADEPLDFAEHVITLLQDREAWNRLSANAKRLVREKYDWQTVIPVYLRLIENVALDRE